MTARELVTAASSFGAGDTDLQSMYLYMLGGYSVTDLLRARIYVSREDRGAQPPPWGWDRRAAR